MICEKCGQELQVGQWPFCPHTAIRGDEYRSTYVPDEIPGGLTLENVGPTPVTVYSYTEMNQLYASRGLTRIERHCPTPGTDHDPAGVQDPAKYIDPYTLEAGKALILRAQGQRNEEAANEEFGRRVFRDQGTRTLSESEAATAQDAIREREEQYAARHRRS